MSERLIPFAIFVDHERKLECHGFKYLSRDGSFTEPENEEQKVVGWKKLDFDADPIIIIVILTPKQTELTEDTVSVCYFTHADDNYAFLGAKRSS